MTYSKFSEFHEAASNWYLDRLYEALAFHKKAPLSEFENKCLCGLLCRRDISYIARLVNWSSKAAVRTELSRGLYLYIKALTGQTRIRWNCIPDLLESEYRRQKNSFYQPDDSSPFDIKFEYRATSIIATISEQKRRKMQVAEEDFNEVSTDAETLIKYGDLKCKFNEYVTAIEAYKEAVELDYSYIGVLNKIAFCYYQACLYDEVEILCKFVISENPRNEIKVKSYNMIGSVYHERALREYRPLYVESASYFFNQASENSVSDVLPAWNIVHLFLSFRNQDKSYMDRAKLALYTFKKIAAQPNSNFHNYRDKIFNEFLGVCDGLEEWWQTQLNELI